MEKINAVWKEEFNTGVDYIDGAHRKLFSVLFELRDVVESNQLYKQKRTAMETVSFLKGYAIKHFAEEEAYQLKIGYKGYAQHKLLHDDFKNNTISAIEEELIKSDFSREALKKFVAILAGWLAGHILIEDRAITGKVSSRYNQDRKKDTNTLLNDEMCHFFLDLCGIKLILQTEHYEGIGIERGLFYEMDYGEGKRVTLIAEHRVILKMSESMLGRECKTMDAEVLTTHTMLSQSVAKGILGILCPEKEYTLKKHCAVDAATLFARFEKKMPQYGFAWRSDEGNVAICVE